jgi:predicted transposase/invertase (TIGR01784 family)
MTIDKIDLTEAHRDLAQVSLRNDIIFKYVFGHEKNMRIVKALLNALLGLKGIKAISELTFINPVNLREYLGAKFSCLDIAARDSEGKRYNIEMQVRGSDSYIARAIYYHDKLYASQLVEGDEYGILKKTLSISILNFVLLEEEKELHNVCRYVILQSGRELTDLKELHFVELPKYTEKKPRERMTKFEKWLYVLKFGELYKDDPATLPAVLRKEEEIVMAVEKMHEAEGNPVVRELMEARQKALHDEATWRAEAQREDRRVGRLEGKRETARAMKTEGIDRAVIVRVTGLSEEEIEEI